MSSTDTDKNDSEKNAVETLDTPAISPDRQADSPDGMNSECRRELIIEIPAEVAQESRESVIRRYSQVARVPGFRKGKVPASMIRSRFAEEVKSDVLETLVPRYFREAVAKERLRPISQPTVRDLEMAEGQPIRFKATFEVLPEIQLGNYQEITVEKPDVTVTNEEVDNELKQLQERQASYDPVDEDRGLVKGDFAQISFEALPKEVNKTEETAEQSSEAKPETPAEPTQPVHMDEVLVEIGGPNTINEFSENLQGAKTGEERQFEVSYAADYYEQRLAGKTFSYKAKVNAIKKKSIPDLSDDFAKELSQDFQTLDDLKTQMRTGMEAERKHKAEHAAKDKLLDQLIEKHSFPVPESLVQHQIDVRLERGLRALAAQGMRTEDMKRLDMNRLRAAQRPAAIKEVKSNLLLDRIAEAEGIHISDEELDHEIEILAQQMKQTPDALRQRLTEDHAVEQIRGRIRSEKALDVLYNKSA
ncbi:MAG TPA: trigger factor [Candidatus Angelobacter sp.]|nr:trigger factor [Candidatus Angelobacter sp.]